MRCFAVDTSLHKVCVVHASTSVHVEAIRQSPQFVLRCGGKQHRRPQHKRVTSNATSSVHADIPFTLASFSLNSVRKYLSNSFSVSVPSPSESNSAHVAITALLQTQGNTVMVRPALHKTPANWQKSATDNVKSNLPDLSTASARRSRKRALRKTKVLLSC